MLKNAGTLIAIYYNRLYHLLYEVYQFWKDYTQAAAPIAAPSQLAHYFPDQHLLLIIEQMFVFINSFQISGGCFAYYSGERRGIVQRTVKSLFMTKPYFDRACGLRYPYWPENP
jgi:hypothetical protein